MFCLNVNQGYEYASTSVSAPKIEISGSICWQITCNISRTIQENTVLMSRGDDSEDESSSDEEQRKPVPEWARGRALMQQLATQVQTDPDEVFQQHRKTCSLDEVFGSSGEAVRMLLCFAGSSS